MKELYLIKRKHGKQIALVVSVWEDYTLEQINGEWKSTTVVLDAKPYKWINTTYPKARVIALAMINSDTPTIEKILDSIQKTIGGGNDAKYSIWYNYPNIDIIRSGTKWYCNYYPEDRVKFWLKNYFVDLRDEQPKVYEQILIKPTWVVAMNMRIIPNTNPTNVTTTTTYTIESGTNNSLLMIFVYGIVLIVMWGMYKRS